MKESVFIRIVHDPIGRGILAASLTAYFCLMPRLVSLATLMSAVIYILLSLSFVDEIIPLTRQGQGPYSSE